MTDITYEPTREHWTPYEPWMRDLLADDARGSWVSSGSENRSTWDIYRCRTDSWAAGIDLRIHPDDVPERPTEDDPDEALAVVIEELVDDHGGTSEWADNEYITRSTALAIARAAREHIAQEPDEALWEEWERLCRKAEAEADRRVEEARVGNGELRDALADMTRQRDGWRERYVELSERMDEAAQDFRITAAERDEWKARYKALRGDVEEMRRDFGQGLWPDFRGVLARDTERGEQA